MREVFQVKLLKVIVKFRIVNPESTDQRDEVLDSKFVFSTQKK